MTNRVKILKQKFSQSLGLPFQEILPESVIEQAIDELKIKYRRRLFDPFVTLWVFLSQVLDVDTESLHTVLLTCKSGAHIKGSWNRDFNIRRKLNAGEVIRLSWDANNYRFNFCVLSRRCVRD